MPENNELRRTPERQQRTTHHRARHAATEGEMRERRRAARQGGQGQARRQTQRRQPDAQQPIPVRKPIREQPRPRPVAPARPRRSPLPLIIGIVAVLALGVGGFFVVRALTHNDKSGTPDQGQNATTELEGGSVEQPAPVSDGSVDINLLMVGDILFHYQVRQSGLQDDGTRNYDHIFEHFTSELANKDIKVLNQETPLGGPSLGGDAPDGYAGYPTFNGPQEIGDAEAKAGFNVILKATNHAMDMGYAGIESEQEFWRTKHPDVAVVGEANPNDPSTSANDVYVYEKDGFKVAILNYTQDLNGNEDPQGAVSMLEEDHVRETMAKARELADMIVVFPHWGEEYETTPNDFQRTWAQTLMNEGADVIIGNHPHVMQPAEVLLNADGKPVPCYWSTGNFVSTSPEDMSLLGVVPELTLHKDADGNCSVSDAGLTVVATHIGMSTDMTTYLLRDWTDDLAATNHINTEVNPDTDNTTLTPAWAKSFCQEVLGSAFDTNTCTLTLDLTSGRSLGGDTASGASEGETTEGESSEGEATGTESSEGQSSDEYVSDEYSSDGTTGSEATYSEESYDYAA